MIARLRGVVDAIGEAHVVVDVNGVGYLVFCGARTLRDLPALGSPVTLLIDTHVREDHIHLYGFSDSLEREWFRLLLTVQGVGAKVALAILSVLTPGALAEAVAAQDKGPVTRASGVGPKLAQRVVLELKDKVPALLDIVSSGAQPGDAPTRTAAGLLSGAASDAVSALVNLGYPRVDAFSTVATVNKAKAGQGVQDLIRGALRELAQIKEAS